MDEYIEQDIIRIEEYLRWHSMKELLECEYAWFNYITVKEEYQNFGEAVMVSPTRYLTAYVVPNFVDGETKIIFFKDANQVEELNISKLVKQPKWCLDITRY